MEASVVANVESPSELPKLKRICVAGNCPHFQVKQDTKKLH